MTPNEEHALAWLRERKDKVYTGVVPREVEDAVDLAACGESHLPEVACLDV